MLHKIFCIPLVIVLLAGLPALALSATPQALQGAVVITSSQAADLHENGARFFDLRTADLFARGHIPGAVRMPYKEKSGQTPDFDPARDRFGIMKLPAQRSTSLVFYAEDADAWPAYKAAAIAVMAGYEKVHWLREGFQAWSGQGLSVAR